VHAAEQTAKYNRRPEYSSRAVGVANLSAQGPGSQVWRPEHLRLAIDAASVALWSWNVDSDHFTMDERAFDLWGVPWADTVSFEELSAHIHPADRDRVRAAFTGTRSVAGSYEIDFRIMLGEEVRWISARGQGADVDIVDRVMFGIFLDVTSRKQAEESHELLAGEMSHRVKNLLAIATGLTHISLRSSKSLEDMAKDLTQRLTSLGRAHDLVRPLPGSEGKAALLGDLLSILLAPYDDPEAFAGRIRVAVPRMGIGDRTATTLAMVIHELATNSVKHGALSVQEGTLDVSGSCDDTHLSLVWAEDGGPAIDGTPEMQGFGGKMVARSIAQQFDGALNYDWQPSGLVVTLRMRKNRLPA
jgi:two-component sensor histidine kinase